MEPAADAGLLDGASTTSARRALLGGGHSADDQGSTDDQGSSHGHGTAGTGRKVSVYVLHGLLMGAAWALIVPAGVLSARFKRVYADRPANAAPPSGRWLDFHRGLMGIAMALTAAGFVVALTDEHSQGLMAHKGHGAIGVAAAALAVLQMCGGIFRPAESATLRSVWRGAHRWCGRLAALLAYINCFLGAYAVHSVEGVSVAAFAIPLVLAPLVAALVYNKRAEAARASFREELQMSKIQREGKPLESK